MKWGGYGPGKAHAIHVDARTQRRLFLAAYAKHEDADIETTIAAMVAEMVDEYIQRKHPEMTNGER